MPSNVGARTVTFAPSHGSSFSHQLYFTETCPLASPTTPSIRRLSDLSACSTGGTTTEDQLAACLIPAISMTQAGKVQRREYEARANGSSGILVGVRRVLATVVTWVGWCAKSRLARSRRGCSYVKSTASYFNCQACKFVVVCRQGSALKVSESLMCWRGSLCAKTVETTKRHDHDLQKAWAQ